MRKGIRSPGRACRGLTLIELMVVVAVLAILATIAIPSYQRYVVSARRADGRAAVTEVALAQERNYSISQRYVSGNGAADFATLVSQVGLDPKLKDGFTKPLPPRYGLAITAGSTGANTSFLITATPDGWDDDDCTKMTINSDGKKDGEPAGAHKCW